MGTRQHRLVGLLAIVVGLLGFAVTGPAAAAPRRPSAPNLGSNVLVLNPSMPQSTIQSELNAIAAQQVPQSSQFTTQRDAIFFEPGTYGSVADPLIFQVGYSTQVAGLGAQPGDVVINGAIDVFNDDNGTCATGCLRRPRQLLAFDVEPDAQRNAAEQPHRPMCRTTVKRRPRMQERRGDVGRVAGSPGAASDRERPDRRCRTSAT